MSALLHNFDIPAGVLGDSATAWSIECEGSAMWRRDLFDLRVPAVNGRMTCYEALERIIDGTGLTYLVINDVPVFVYIEGIPKCRPELGADAPVPPCTR